MKLKGLRNKKDFIVSHEAVLKSTSTGMLKDVAQVCNIQAYTSVVTYHVRSPDPKACQFLLQVKNGFTKKDLLWCRSVSPWRIQ